MRFTDWRIAYKNPDYTKLKAVSEALLVIKK